MEMQLKPHTVLMLVGPTECGKSTFVEKILKPQLGVKDEGRNFHLNAPVISSDSIRQQLLGVEYDKHSSIMIEASKQAFELMYKQLDVATSYPISAEFPIVDTTGMSEIHRKKVMDIAKKNHYSVDVVVFDYNDNKDYYDSEKNRKIIANQVRRLRKDVMKELKSKYYANVHRIKKKEFILEDGTANTDEFKVSLDFMEGYKETFLTHDKDYVVVGDIHEHVQGLKDVLKKHKMTFDGDRMVGSELKKNFKFVLVGDWLDKGNQTREITEFIHLNQDWFLFVLGNHENFVYKYLTNELDKDSVDGSLVQEQFTSIQVLENDVELKEKALELIEKAKPFYQYRGIEKKSFIVTHAPCEDKFLGKMDAKSAKAQRVFRVNREENLDEQLRFLEESTEYSHPYHVFGHIPVKRVMRLQNKLNIDTGAVSGNMLTTVEMSETRPYFYSVYTEALRDEKERLPVLFDKDPQEQKYKQLEFSDRMKVHRKAQEKINYVSGTISPADKDEEKGELESLGKGLDHFKKEKVEKVILQPKYMGSRAQVYLFKDRDKTYAVSRRGFVIDEKRFGLDLTPVWESLESRYKRYMEENDIHMMLLDGELLPWSAIGSGLIKNSFEPVVKGVETEVSLLESLGFDQEVEKVIEDFEASDFEQLNNQMKNKEVMNHFGSRDYQRFKNIKGYHHVPVEEHREMMKMFKEQVNHFGKEEDVYYRAFDVLKMVKEDGSESIYSNDQEEIFKFVSADDYLVVDVNDEHDRERAYEFFNYLSGDLNMEGIVIKPLNKHEGDVPFMKVRNHRYLTIVYGYDYLLPYKYEKLMREKNIRGKVKVSKKEKNLGNQLLEIPYAKVNEDNEDYRNVMADLLFAMKKEEELDPRL